MAIGIYISIITLNVNGLNAPSERHRLAKWMQKQDSYICCLQETHFRPQDTYRLKVRGGKNLQQDYCTQQESPFKMDVEIKSFSDKQKLREFSTIKPALQQALRRLI